MSEKLGRPKNFKNRKIVRNRFIETGDYLNKISVDTGIPFHTIQSYFKEMYQLYGVSNQQQLMKALIMQKYKIQEANANANRTSNRKVPLDATR